MNKRIVYVPWPRSEVIHQAKVTCPILGIRKHDRMGDAIGSVH